MQKALVKRWITVVMAGVAIAWAACSDDGGPRLDAAMPPAATRNAVVELTGRRLCGRSGACASAAGMGRPAVAAAASRLASKLRRSKQSG